MTVAKRILFLFAALVCSPALLFGQELIENWPSPPFWSPPARASASAGDLSEPSLRREEAQVVPTAALPFFGITPCRLADTRGNGFTGQYGPPQLTPAGRNVTITGQCGIPPGAEAVSFNFSAINVSASGFFVAYPAGASFPPVATMTYGPSTPVISNAAIVPLGTGGAITIVAAVTNIDLTIDVNGYYAGSVVTSVTAGTGLTGGGTGAVTVGIAAGGVGTTELATGAVTSAKIGANAVTAGAIASGQVVKSLNGLHDAVTIAGSGGANVSTGASTITVSAPLGVPSGTFVLGNPADSTLIGAGYTELVSNTDFWTATTTAGAPTARGNHTAVWTGTRMIVWGGSDGTFLNTGGQYDPVGNSWTATTTTGTPAVRASHTAVWTGTRMIVWGGTDGTPLNTGGQYDPVGNSWTATTTTGAPTVRYLHKAVWTGTRMIVWGGNDGGYLNTGGQYDPVGNSWTATTTTNAPTVRNLHTAVWTDTRMIVWGGLGAGNLNTGGQYDPVGNSWTATTTTGAPTARYNHTAVWTGTRMIVWGGSDGFSNFTSGGQYDPGGNSWTATTTTGAPAGRQAPTAVWTGTRMIVWGGTEGGAGYLNSGGQYDPVGNSWTTATTTAGAPSARFSHTAVWTGTRMIVWGGVAGTYFNTGGQYGTLSLYVKN